MALITRANASGLIPAPIANEIIKAMPSSSAALAMARTVTMPSGTHKMPVMSVLPTAAWVNPSDTGRKTTTTASWDGINLVAEELAVLVPVPDAVIDDASFDIWGELRDSIVEAIGFALDAAIIGGVNTPAGWTLPSIIGGAVTAANVVDSAPASPPAGWDYAAAVNAALALVESDGFDPTAAVATLTTKATLRGLRDTTGQPIMQPISDGGQTIYGLRARFTESSKFGSLYAAPSMVVGDFSKAVVGIRQDITFKMSDSAVITGAGNTVDISAFEQDMTVMRCVFRVGFAVANPATRANASAATRWPFAVIGNP